MLRLPAGRAFLIALYVIGVLVLCVSFLAGDDRTRLVERVCGAALVFSAGLAAEILKMRKLKEEPYTTTDWVKGRRRQQNQTQQGVVKLLLWLGWGVQILLADGGHSKVRPFLLGLMGVLCLVTIGMDLVRKPGGVRVTANADLR